MTECNIDAPKQSQRLGCFSLTADWSFNRFINVSITSPQYFVLCFKVYPSGTCVGEAYENWAIKTLANVEGSSF